LNYSLGSIDIIGSVMRYVKFLLIYSKMAEKMYFILK
jgi:hypothetical protein